MNSHLFSQIKEDSLILTANRRLAINIRQIYDQFQITQGKLSWSTLKIMPLETWLTLSWQQLASTSEQLLSGFQEHYLWEKMISSQANRYPLLQVEQTAKLVHKAWQLLWAWQIPISSLVNFIDSPEIDAMYRWAQQFLQDCQQHHWRSQAEIPQCLINQIDQLSSLESSQHILIIGFDEMPPIYQQLIHLLKKDRVVAEILNEPYSRKASTVTFSNLEMEMTAMAQWAKDYHFQNPTHTIGCIVPQLTQHRSRLTALFQKTFTIENQIYNMAGGDSLSTFSIIRLALTVLTLGLGQLSLENCAEWLQSHYLCQNETDLNLGAMLDVELRRSHQFELPLTALFTPISRWQSHYPHNTWLNRWREFLKQLEHLPDCQLPSRWALVFIRQLQSLGWPGGRSLNSLEHQLIQRWQELLEEFSQLDSFTGIVSQANAVQILDQLCRQTLFQPASLPNAPIQILGILESGGLHFDALWIMGLDEQNWPPPPQPNPFIPHRLQIQKQMPHADSRREFHYAQLITRRLLQSAPEICLSCSPSQENLSAAFSSLTLQQLNVGNAVIASASNDMLISYAKIIFASAQKEMIEDSIAPAVTSSEEIRGGSSLLTRQAECPFRAFALSRLNATALPEFNLGLTPIERGYLTHNVLEKIWGSLDNQRNLLAMSDSKLWELISTTVDAVVNEQAPPYTLQSFLQVEKIRLRSLIRHWLNLEKQRPEFTVIAQETEHVIEVGALKLQIKIDRIDQLNDGSQMLIDYKTGRTDLKYWFGDRPQRPQLPLYAVYADKHQKFSAITFAQLRFANLTFNGLHVESTEADELFPQGVKAISKNDWQDLLRDWRQSLENLAEEFTHGYALANPNQQSQPCETCHLQTLCRVHSYD